MGMNDMKSIRMRLVRGISKISDSDVRILFMNMLNDIEELQNELETLRTSGCSQVCPGEDPKPGAKRGRKPRGADGKGPEAAGDD
jgi:hypothetical protein